MKYLILLNIVFSFLIGNEFSDFAYFNKQDKQTFKYLSQKAQKCINSWDFSCASSALDKMKLYVTSPKDKKIISSLWNKYYDEKEAKRDYEEKKRNRSVNVKIKDCYKKICSVYINGEYTGTMAYWWDSGGYYVTSYRKNEGSGLLGRSGYYYPNSKKVYVVDCGRKYGVYSLEEAMKYVVKCIVSGHY